MTKDEKRYLWGKFSSISRSKFLFSLIRLFIEISSLPVIGELTKFLSNRLNYHLFTFVNGRMQSREFLECANLLRIGKNCNVYYPQKIEIGNYVSLGNFITLYNQSRGGLIKIGNNTHISDFSYLSGVGGLEIGNDVSISSGVKIYSHSNVYGDKKKLIRDQVKAEKIIIGNNVLIGANVVILPGVKIGDNCVIGAGAVVTTNIPINCIAIGIPAKFKMREK